MNTKSILDRLTSGLVCRALFGGAILALAIPAQAAATAPKPTIVLVHGAFADGTGWSKVILRLEKAGYTTIAVQNPLRTLAEDIATTQRMVDAVPGPVVLVGHSYGGVVISGVASPNVKALVYVAAFAPDAGEKIGELLGKFAPAALGGALRPDSAGFLFIDRAQFQQVFAADVTKDEATVMAVAQKPVAAGIFESPLSAAAWKNLPSWFLVATEDTAIQPELQRFMATRIGAKSIVEVKASHVPFVSQPDAVVKLIEAAAR